MSTHPRRLRTVPAVPAPVNVPSQQDWVWDGANWTWDGNCPAPPPCPPPCPPVGWPQPCPPFYPPPSNQAPWYPGANGGVSFSQTAPVNPIRGNFWWDGTMLHLFDGAVWVNIGPGAGSASGLTVVGSAPPSNPAVGQEWWNGTALQVWDGVAWRAVGAGISQCLQMGNPASLTIPTNAWTVIPFTTTPAIDTASGWNVTNQQYKPNLPGFYLFFIRAWMASGTAGGQYGVALAKNDPGTFTNSTSVETISIITEPTSTVGTWMTIGGVSHLNGTSDYVRLWGYSTPGTIYGTGTIPFMNAYLMPGT